MLKKEVNVDVRPRTLQKDLFVTIFVKE